MTSSFVFSSPSLGQVETITVIRLLSPQELHQRNCFCECSIGTPAQYVVVLLRSYPQNLSSHQGVTLCADQTGQLQCRNLLRCDLRHRGFLPLSGWTVTSKASVLKSMT